MKYPVRWARPAARRHNILWQIVAADEVVFFADAAGDDVFWVFRLEFFTAAVAWRSTRMCVDW